MSGIQPDQTVPSSSAGSFSQFRTQTPEPRRRTHESIWKKLAEAVPKTEEEWQAARVRQSFDSSRGIPGALTHHLDSKESNLQLIVFFAACKVDSYGKRVPYSTVRAFLGNPDLTEPMIGRYLNTVVRMVKLLDELYLTGPRHRAFELLLYIPTKLANLRQYVENPARFKLRCATSAPRPEAQGSLALYIPFLVGLKRPDLGYDRICEALGTRLFDQQEFSRFLFALQTRNLAPRLPPLPSFTPPLRIIQHFETFSLSERLRKKARESADQLRGFNPVAPATPVETNLYGYQWSPTHQAIVDESVTYLVRLLSDLL
ncbi:hypothetical protein F66182_6473 [Fusarium sp. NRRL 66182]|nr:hypothetical protein F66182_6473 [Fusarium sp. NRRL 66182]